jgi:hypothetical protein
MRTTLWRWRSFRFARAADCVSRYVFQQGTLHRLQAEGSATVIAAIPCHYSVHRLLGSLCMISELASEWQSKTMYGMGLETSQLRG